MWRRIFAAEVSTYRHSFSNRLCVTVEEVSDATAIEIPPP
jgi:hypothetical protein